VLGEKGRTIIVLGKQEGREGEWRMEENGQRRRNRENKKNYTG